MEQILLVPSAEYVFVHLKEVQSCAFGEFHVQYSIVYGLRRHESLAELHRETQRP